MTDALVASPTHDAEIAAMLARTEETLGSLVVLNDALNNLTMRYRTSSKSSGIYRI